MTLILIYVVKIITLNNFQQVLAVARYLLKSLKNKVSFLQNKTKILCFKIYFMTFHAKRLPSHLPPSLETHETIPVKYFYTDSKNGCKRTGIKGQVWINLLSNDPVGFHFRFIESNCPHAAVLFMYVSYSEKGLNSLTVMFPPTRRVAL